MEEIILYLLELLIFPGIIFISTLALFFQWFDRKIHARFQNRVGPLVVGPKGLLQPLADFIKLLSKEDITPISADRTGFILAPIITLTLAVISAFFIPVMSYSGILSFSGDVIVVLFFSTILTFMIAFAGYSATNRFSTIGAARTALQFISYEIPYILSVIAVVIISRSLQISEIVASQVSTYGLPYVVLLPIAFVLYLVSLLAKLEKIPFDIPEAETEIVGGWSAEYSGKKLAFFKLAIDIKMVVGAGLAVAFFLGGPYGPVIPGIEWLCYTFWFIVKTLVLVFILSNLRTLFARYRIDQMVKIFWDYITPLAFLQLILAEGFVIYLM